MIVYKICIPYLRLTTFSFVYILFAGTVWNLTDVIEGAGAGVRALQDIGKRVIYITNNAMRPEDKYMARFKESEINASFVSVIYNFFDIMYLSRYLNSEFSTTSLSYGKFRKFCYLNAYVI